MHKETENSIGNPFEITCRTLVVVKKPREKLYLFKMTAFLVYKPATVAFVVATTDRSLARTACLTV